MSRLLTTALALSATIVACGGDDPTQPEVGTLQVVASTSGDDVDQDGYMVTLDGAQSQTVDANGAVTFSEVTAGAHLVELSGVASNCTVDGANPKSATSNAGANFDVNCILANRIAFWSNRDGQADVYVMNSDGSGQTNLTNNPAIDVSPDWSPGWNKNRIRDQPGWKRRDLRDEFRRHRPREPHEFVRRRLVSRVVPRRHDDGIRTDRDR